MGRKRIHFSKISDKTLKCKTCGKEHRCSGDAVEVQCDICLIGAKRVTANDPIPAPANLPTEKRKRGRPRKVDATKSFDKVLDLKKIENNALDLIMNDINSLDKKKETKVKKGKTMDKVEKKVDVKGGSGKRGRKATVGSAVLGYIQGQKGEVKFTDILNVYSAEREKLGKKAAPEIETRNCHSTLYVMVRDGKIREVQKKSVYSAC